jgi:high affinity Mn2+ porin
LQDHKYNGVMQRAVTIILLLILVMRGSGALFGQTSQISAPTTQTTRPLISFSTVVIPIELPSLSGRLVDQFQYSFHGQATITPFFHGDFPSGYQGPHSFSSNYESATAYTGTVFAGIRVLPGTEIYFNPEVTAGRGLSGVLGLGDPPNSDSRSVATPDPAPDVARLFLRQTFGFGGEQEDIVDGPNLIAGKQDINRLTVTVGKYAASDIFDNNAYAHDGRSQFMNWGLSDDNAWDYAADAEGYTDGLTLELNQKFNTIRYGIFRPPALANRGQLDTHYDRAFCQVVEYEQRYTLGGQAGAIRPMFFFNYAHMGDYRQAIVADPTDPDVTDFRSYSHPKYGFSVSAEQAITADLGIFGRAGWNNGQSESWSYTEVDRGISLGLSLKGARWNRPSDTVGLAGVMSGLSKDHRDYLAAGGLGFELGDGRLNYAPEEVIETYYSVVLTKNLFLAADYQFIDHPGYNADRGPVSIGGLRVHFEF